MEENLLSFCDGYSKRVYEGAKKTKADRLKDDKVLAKSIKRVLNSEVEVEGGMVSLVDLYAAKVVCEALKNPNVKDAKILNDIIDTNQKVDVNVVNAKELFGDIAIKK